VSRAKIVITGVKALDKRLKELGPKLANKIARKALREEMKPLKADVVSNTPKDTGALARSTKLQAMKRSRSRIGVEVVMFDGTDDDRFVAAFVELGTSTTPGAGMMRHAYDANKDAVRDGILDRIRQGIEQEA
jgi:HK97 gp10 family phage protein